jgi:hypothetical protein
MIARLRTRAGTVLVHVSLSSLDEHPLMDCLLIVSEESFHDAHPSRFASRQ